MKVKRRQSKRLTLKKKYKILRKVREHKRKVRKESKVISRRKKDKDPGIPNNYPFKAQALAAIERMKLLEEEEKQLEKQRRAKLQQVKRQQAIEKKRQEQEARRLKQEKFELRGSKRKIYGRCRDVAEEADIIVEVLDARDPLGCISPEVETWIRTNYPEKLFVRVLNKIDLVPKEIVLRWLTYLRGEGYPALAFKCPVKKKEKSKNRKLKRFVLPSEPVTHRITPHTCLGLDNLTQLFKNYADSFSDGRSVTVGIIGWPGVGRSSLLEQLKTVKSATLQAEENKEFWLTETIRVLDFVGLIIPSSELSPIDLCLRNCMAPDNVPNLYGAVEKILSRVGKENILDTYQVSMFQNAKEFLELVAIKGGKMAKGGKANVAAAAKMVIKHWLEGKIKFYAEPPAASGAGTTSTTVANKNWSEMVKMSDLQRSEEEKIYPLLKTGTLDSFASLGGEGVFARKVEAKFLNYLEGGEMDEEEQEEEDEMDEVEEDEDEEDEGEESHDDKGKGKAVVKKTRKASSTKKPPLDLDAAFDFSTDFVATTDAAVMGGVEGDDDEDDGDYAEDDSDDQGDIGGDEDEEEDDDADE